MNDLMECAISAACKYEIGSLGGSICSLRTRGAAALSCNDFNLKTVTEKYVRGTFEHAETWAAAASGVWVEDEDRARHALRLHSSEADERAFLQYGGDPITAVSLVRLAHQVRAVHEVQERRLPVWTCPDGRYRR